MDGVPAEGIKLINKVAKHLYHCGYVQNVEVSFTNTNFF